jgi:hypothetical protein
LTHVSRAEPDHDEFGSAPSVRAAPREFTPSGIAAGRGRGTERAR